MKTYDALVIFPPEVTGLDSKNSFEDLVKKHEGKIVNRVEMGKRFLGYIVKKTKEAYVASFEFELAPNQMGPLRRALDLSDDIIKYTIVVKSKTKTLLPTSVPEKR